MSPRLLSVVPTGQYVKADREAATPQRILIIEDEPVLAKNMKTYLSRYAGDVRTAPDAVQALDMLESFTPDALVLDYGLPDVDGLRTYAEITRHQAKNIDCVMMTGNLTEQLAQDASELGIHHLVCKPFRFSELLRLLREPAQPAAGNAAELEHERKGVDNHALSA